MPRYTGRRIELCPPKSVKERLQEQAREAGIPLSKYILNALEGPLPWPENGMDGPNAQELREENEKLKQELSNKRLLLEKYENELNRLKATAFLDPHFRGSRFIDTRLLEILRERGPIHDGHLITALGIDLKDTEMVQAISAQLTELEAFGVVRRTSAGWRWCK